MRENEEKYSFVAGPQGQKEVLNALFNTTTQAFLKKAGLKSGMEVLDVGCGIGIMSCWLAEQVGTYGKIIAIDNNEKVLEVAKSLADSKKLNNIHFKRLKVEEVSDLKARFDFVLCRFVLQHLLHPVPIIRSLFESLTPGGILVAEEGIVSSAFTYPASDAWGYRRWSHRTPIPLEDLEGQQPDPNFGLKLFSKILQAGFKILEADLIQPFLFKREDKERLLYELLENKNSFIKGGGSEAEWQARFNELEEMVYNENQIVAFYQSCQVAGKKPNSITELETSIVKLKALKISEVNDVAQVFKEDIVENPKEAVALIEKTLIRSQTNFKKHCVGLYGIYHKSNQRLIGLAGFDFRIVGDNTENVLLIRLAEEYKEDDSILSDIVFTLREMAFNDLCLSRLVAFLDDSDLILLKVLQTMGFQFEGKFTLHDDTKDIYATNRNSFPLKNKDHRP